MLRELTGADLGVLRTRRVSPSTPRTAWASATPPPAPRPTARHPAASPSPRSPSCPTSPTWTRWPPNPASPYGSWTARRPRRRRPGRSAGTRGTVRALEWLHARGLAEAVRRAPPKAAPCSASAAATSCSPNGSTTRSSRGRVRAGARPAAGTDPVRRRQDLARRRAPRTASPSGLRDPPRGAELLDGAGSSARGPARGPVRSSWTASESAPLGHPLARLAGERRLPRRSCARSPRRRAAASYRRRTPCSGRCARSSWTASAIS